MEDDHLVLKFSRSDPSLLDTTLTGQWSTDFVEWHDITPVMVNDNGTAPDSMEIRIPLSNSKDGRLFGRSNAVLSKP